MNERKLRFGLPKGSLQDATVEKMAKAGWNIQVSSRSYVAYVDDAELEIIPELDAESEADDVEAGADVEAEAETEAEAVEPIEAAEPDSKPKKGRGRPKK